MFSVGLTGGIACGKSTVAACLVECGAHLVDTDRIARELTLPGGAALPALVSAFGRGVLGADQALDRNAMRQRAFSDPAAKALLESILHPLIKAQTERLASAAAGRPLLFDVPLLAESDRWRARVDRVLVVDCEEATQIERVARRPGWSRELAHAVVAQQSSRAVRRALADAVIHNESISLAGLCQQARQIWDHWNPALA